MARIGVFGLNLSPKTGGIYALIEGLMAHAGHSRHAFLYLAQRRDPEATLPPNVVLVERPPAARLAAQCIQNLPHVNGPLGRRNLAVGALAAAAGLSPRVFSSVDAWLWPHCFKAVPNLGRTVVICHDMIHRHHPECFSRSDLAMRERAERSLPGCAAVLCPSRASLDDLLSAYPQVGPRACLFSESPCRPSSPAQEPSPAERRLLEATFARGPVFLYVGVDWAHKNHDLLIDAAVALRATTSLPFHVVFAGHRRRGDAVARSIALRGAGDVVTDLGTVSHPVLAALYQKATALVFPSLCEGFGIPLVEAMQYALPVLASDRAPMAEVCGDAAVLLPATAAQPWAEQMLRLMTDPGHHARLSDLSRRRGVSFNWRRTWREVDVALAVALGGAADQGEHLPGPVPYTPPAVAARVGG